MAEVVALTVGTPAIFCSIALSAGALLGLVLGLIGYAILWR